MDIWNWLFINQPVWVSNVSNLTAITAFGAIIGLYKRFNCDQQGCWRIGVHRVEGTTYHTCAKHTTAQYHDALHARHAKARPEQHKLLARSTK